jgi:hypothetical protein
MVNLVERSQKKGRGSNVTGEKKFEGGGRFLYDKK